MNEAKQAYCDCIRQRDPVKRFLKLAELDRVEEQERRDIERFGAIQELTKLLRPRAALCARIAEAIQSPEWPNVQAELGEELDAIDRVLFPEEFKKNPKPGPWGFFVNGLLY